MPLVGLSLIHLPLEVGNEIWIQNLLDVVEPEPLLRGGLLVEGLQEAELWPADQRQVREALAGK